MTLAETMQADTSWCAVLAHHATRTPDKAITIFEGQTTTYAEMAERAAALAGGLAEHGVRPGEVVGLLSYNCTEFLETIFAANHLGAIAMPINWRLAAPEVRYILEHSEARALVCDPELVDVAHDATEGFADDFLRVCVTRPAPGGWMPIDDVRAATGATRVPVDGVEVDRLVYTSGPA